MRVLGRALKNQLWQLSLVLCTSGGTEIICLANLGLRVKLWATINWEELLVSLPSGTLDDFLPNPVPEPEAPAQLAIFTSLGGIGLMPLGASRHIMAGFVKSKQMLF